MIKSFEFPIINPQYIRTKSESEITIIKFNKLQAEFDRFRKLTFERFVSGYFSQETIDAVFNPSKTIISNYTKRRGFWNKFYDIELSGYLLEEK